MSQLTRANIAYNLNVSPFKISMQYDSFNMDYVFSSELYKRKFIERQKENREKINQSLSNRFGFAVDVPILADLKLYTTIEKRGFLIFKDGEKIECLEYLTLDGMKIKMPS